MNAFLSVASSLFAPASKLAKQAIVSHLITSNDTTAQDIALQTEADKLEGLLNDIKVQDYNAAHFNLRHVFIVIANHNNQNSASELTEQEKETINGYLQKAIDLVHRSIDLFKSKEESVCRMWCAKVGVLFYLYRRIFLNIAEDTFSHCMEYVQLALNSYGWGMINDIVNDRDSLVTQYLFKDKVARKRYVHDGMKALVTLMFQHFNPPTDACLPFWNLFVEADKPRAGANAKWGDCVGAGNFVATFCGTEIMIWKREDAPTLVEMRKNPFGGESWSAIDNKARLLCASTPISILQYIGRNLLLSKERMTDGNMQVWDCTSGTCKRRCVIALHDGELEVGVLNPTTSALISAIRGRYSTWNGLASILITETELIITTVNNEIRIFDMCSTAQKFMAKFKLESLGMDPKVIMDDRCIVTVTPTSVTHLDRHSDNYTICSLPFSAFTGKIIHAELIGGNVLFSAVERSLLGRKYKQTVGIVNPKAKSMQTIIHAESSDQFAKHTTFTVDCMWNIILYRESDSAEDSIVIPRKFQKAEAQSCNQLTDLFAAPSSGECGN